MKNGICSLSFSSCFESNLKGFIEQKNRAYVYEHIIILFLISEVEVEGLLKWEVY